MIAMSRSHIRRLALTASLCGVSALAACSDSTSPASVGGSAFSVDVRFVGGTPPAGVQGAFTSAAQRMSQVITTALTPIDVTGLSAATLCGESSLPALSGVVNNIIIYVEVDSIDGAGHVLAQSGPCGLRSSTSLPFVGLMKFDSADLTVVVANGTINSLVLHEMQHVLGFGTLWFGPPDFPTSLLASAGTADPAYVGTAARAQYVAAGGSPASGVPVEGGAAPGTSNSHWRETVFGTELMTGFLNGSSQPFSKISIGALADLGYSVSYAASDAFVVPGSAALRSNPGAASETTVNEELIRPRFKVDGRGNVTTILTGGRGPGGK